MKPKRKAPLSGLSQSLAASAPAPSKTEYFGFLLMPEFSMLSFASVLEPLRMANRISKVQLYNWQLFSPDDDVIRPSNGIEFLPTRQREESADIDTLIVVAGINPLKYCNTAIFGWLRDMVKRGVRLGATSTGPLILARARLLNGYKSTIHWENLDGFREQYPGIFTSEELFECDRDRFTCSGGTAGLDLMMHLIGLRHGKALAQSIAEQCIHPKIRPAHDLQRMALPVRFSVDHPRLVEAISHMETHLEDPLACATIAELVGLSQRHFERLFQDRLGSTPARFYKRMRLERATALLEQTSMSILEIAVACGFSSAAHFSASYVQVFSSSPHAIRLRLRAV
ncbi:GlxA family transcriptional regulator [Polaromonas sp. CG_23.6]|uniref:GlxA family transcriptional regulator n=1 Tax=Polaromonas sp. CG_23.6 TaxID=2760709 RepID=UPI002475C61A|nr:GlxA family transcriptional regulator [Polaromonas sp. CG_23.6]MDH6186952.1 transcriptional regulator GlxA family with amidase domain [Polaromonas sp. CG_23.6]